MTEQTRVDLDRLLAEICRTFYAADLEGKFFRDRPMLQKAVTWPATWLRARGLTWTSDRYFKTLGELLKGIRRHGATGEVKYFPGYLLKCLQDHFAHNGDAYCDEGRRLRNSVNTALSSVRFADSPTTPSSSTVDILAAAHALLASRRRTLKIEPAGDQMGLL
jgi:hypothetical protein